MEDKVSKEPKNKLKNLWLTKKDSFDINNINNLELINKVISKFSFNQ